ncbi:fumarylacetoacetate hydrolase family protein [Streptomyces sp. NBC_00882]|nr:fumarylacetoacetate hydrolase family protein [Streptomyces sp. NBC_00882]WSZ63674.1 fumarylacetoacetate hydrolase family protein [Streptomyces canus]
MRLEHVFGYMVANDVSQRDLQRAHGDQWLKGKSIDGTMPLGPWLTTADEISDLADLRVQCEVNGRTLQSASSSQMAFSFAGIVAELSYGMTLRAGDVVPTGTPSGIGSAREPQILESYATSSPTSTSFETRDHEEHRRVPEPATDDVSAPERQRVFHQDVQSAGRPEGVRSYIAQGSEATHADRGQLVRHVFPRAEGIRGPDGVPP